MSNHSGANQAVISSKDLQAIITAYLDAVVQITNSDDMDTYAKAMAIDNVTIGVMRCAEAFGYKTAVESA